MFDDSSNVIARAPRADTNWIAIIRTLDGVEIPCNVKDVSKTGARIGVPASCPLPDIFMLRIVGKDIVCRVSLAWRKGNFVGVHIEQFGKVVRRLNKPSKRGSKSQTLPTKRLAFVEVECLASE